MHVLSQLPEGRLNGFNEPVMLMLRGLVANSLNRPVPWHAWPTLSDSWVCARLDTAQCVIADTWACAVRVLNVQVPPLLRIHILSDMSSLGTLVTTLYFETSLPLDSSATILHCYTQGRRGSLWVSTVPWEHTVLHWDCPVCVSMR